MARHGSAWHSGHAWRGCLPFSWVAPTRLQDALRQPVATWSTLLEPNVMYGLYIGTCLSAVQQFTGEACACFIFLSLLFLFPPAPPPLPPCFPLTAPLPHPSLAAEKASMPSISTRKTC